MTFIHADTILCPIHHFHACGYSPVSRFSCTQILSCVHTWFQGLSGRNKHRGSVKEKYLPARNKQKHDRRPNKLIWQHGIPLFARLPKWRHAIHHWRWKRLDWCSLRKLKKFLEKGRLDARLDKIYSLLIVITKETNYCCVFLTFHFYISNRYS